MIKKFTLFLMVLISGITMVMAQTPNAFNYQAVVRDNNGDILPDQFVKFRISIIKGDINGSSVYIETHEATTTSHGVIALQIGNGDLISGNFNDIAWGHSSFFVQIEIDIDGGNNFKPLGTTQLLSVPYALHAKTFDPLSKLEITGVGDSDYNPLIIKNNSSATINTIVASDVDYHHGGLTIRRSRGTLDNPSKLMGGDRIGGLYGRGYFDDDYYVTSSIEMFAADEAGSGSYSSNIRFSTTPNYGMDRVERLRISENGNIGVNTTTPNYTLDVNGIINANGFSINGTPLNNSSHWEQNASDIYFSSGNVGIGADNPSTKLEIIGDGDSNYNPLIIKNNSSGTINTVVASDVDYHHGGLTIRRSRGTFDNPSQLMGGDRIGGLYSRGYFDDDYYVTSSIEMFTADGAGSGSYSSNIRFFTTDDLETEKSERMRIDESGNVGVGTTSPKTKLQISKGDVYLDQIGSGVIMKSPNGQCWRLTVDNSGNPNFESVSCPE